jgi:hypothetical protein
MPASSLSSSPATNLDQVLKLDAARGQHRFFQGVQTMTMTVMKHVCLFAAIVAPGLALADEQKPAAAPQAQSLATMETILEHCAKLNPAAADQYREQAKQLTQGASDETLAKVRNSEEYRQSRDSTIESLAKVDEQGVKKACALSLSQNK